MILVGAGLDLKRQPVCVGPCPPNKEPLDWCGTGVVTMPIGPTMGAGAGVKSLGDGTMTGAVGTVGEGTTSSGTVTAGVGASWPGWAGAGGDETTGVSSCKGTTGFGTSWPGCAAGAGATICWSTAGC